MLFKYIVYIYNKLKGYIYSNNSKVQYKIPFDSTLPKPNNYDINKTIFALNNMPDIIHNLLFENDINVASNYYYIRLDIVNKTIDHNLDLLKNDIDNDNIKYIFIRLNLVNCKYFNHVNGIYINKSKYYTLIFEPKYELIYNPLELESLLKNYTNNYQFIYAKDIGYTIYNRMQSYDLFCQTYVLFSFLLIVLNDGEINYENYCEMFSSVITPKNVEYLLYHIDNLLKKNNYDICNQPELWVQPNDKFNEIKNVIRFIFNNKKEEDISNLNICEEDGLVMIENYSVNSVSNAGDDNEDLNDALCNLNKSSDPSDNISAPPTTGLSNV